MSSCFLTNMRNTENKSLNLFSRKALNNKKKLCAVVLALSLLSAVIGKLNYSHECDAKWYTRESFIIPVLFRFPYVHKADNHQIRSIQFGEMPSESSGDEVWFWYPKCLQCSVGWGWTSMHLQLEVMGQHWPPQCWLTCFLLQLEAEIFQQPSCWTHGALPAWGGTGTA